MSDASARLRDAASVYEASYPPSILGGGTGPHIDTITPNTFTVDTPSIILTITGRNFAADSVVEADQQEASGVYDSPTQMRVQLSGGLGLGPHVITIRNADDSESNSYPINVAPAPPPPVLTSIAPTTAAEGAGNITLTVNGTGLVDGSVVIFGMLQKSGTWVSATQMTFTVDPATQGVGTHDVKVMTPTMLQSNALPFVITATVLADEQNATVIDVDQAPAPKSKSKKGAKDE